MSEAARRVVRDGSGEPVVVELYVDVGLWPGSDGPPGKVRVSFRKDASSAPHSSPSVLPALVENANCHSMKVLFSRNIAIPVHPSMKASNQGSDVVSSCMCCLGLHKCNAC